MTQPTKQPREQRRDIRSNSMEETLSLSFHGRLAINYITNRPPQNFICTAQAR